MEEVTAALEEGKDIELNKITDLDLEGYILKDEQIPALCRGLSGNTSITWLNFKHCELKSHMYHGIFQALSNHPTLTHLKLNGNNNVAKHLSELLSHNTALTRLNLSGCDVGDEGLPDLSAALQRNSSLKSLNLSANNIAIEKSGARMLNEILKLNRLTKINLKGNHFHHFDTKSIKILSEGLQQNNSLTVLNLANNWIESVGYQWLSVGLGGHPALTSLDLSGSSIAHSAKWLEELLAHNHVIKELKLNYAEVTEEVCRVLGLHFNQLQKVTLEQNELTEKGAHWLAQALNKTNSQLRELHLMRNSIGSSGCRAICTSLQSNVTLQLLDLRFNQIGADASTQVRDMLRVNKGLRSLSLSSNELNIRVIMEALADNSVLRELDAGKY